MTTRPWYVRWLRAVERFAEWVQDDGWPDCAPEVPRTLAPYTNRLAASEQRATPTRSEP